MAETAPGEQPNPAHTPEDVTATNVTPPLNSTSTSSSHPTPNSSPSIASKKEDEALQDDDNIDGQKDLETTELPPLLPGELLTFTDTDVIYLDPFLGPQTGNVFISDYKMYFKSVSTDDQEEPFILNVPLGVISHVEKIGRSRNKRENAYGLEIYCKDMRTLRFAHNQETHGRRLMYERLQIVAFSTSFGKNVFAYSFKEKFDEDGWLIYDPTTELKRLGVGKEDVPWRITEVNQEFKLCETYPLVLGVPLSVTDDDLRAVAQFRSKGRIPALSWLHPITHASITRCSQPLAGAPAKRSQEDEAYISAICKASNSNKLYILDARPRINAIANAAVGGGWERDEHYPNTEFSFLDIGNIHVMREGLRKLQDICYPDVDDQRWFSSLEATHWLEYIKDVLGGSVRVAELIERQKLSVVIHCTDGWDRTAQISALSQLMLDPYYRTIRGFELLVEKEWVSFGHKFSQRIGHGDRNYSDDQRSPIFLQFIDCVWQMTVQFPYAFEFNEHFLITILDHLYSCLFGTFLCNCEKQRMDTGVRQRTTSLWSFINGQIDIYKNPLYSEHIHQQVLFPSTSIRKLQLWNGYYLRWNPRMRPQEGEFERCRQLQVLIKLLQEKCQELNEQQKSPSNRATAVI